MERDGEMSKIDHHKRKYVPHCVEIGLPRAAFFPLASSWAKMKSRSPRVCSRKTVGNTLWKRRTGDLLSIQFKCAKNKFSHGVRLADYESLSRSRGVEVTKCGLQHGTPTVCHDLGFAAPLCLRNGVGPYKRRLRAWKLCRALT